jgi:nicotinamide phosphoribosyltransferase
MSILLRTDVYKFSHCDQYPQGTNKVYSYLCSRGTRLEGVDKTVAFGFGYYLDKYLKCPTETEVHEFIYYAEKILGPNAVSNEHRERLYNLAKLGYLPIEIKAVPEGSVVPVKNVLMTITNTLPGYFWLVNYIETLLLKVWHPITVATNSLRFKKLFDRYAEETCEDNSHTVFQMHDFGYRGVSSEESAEIGGAAHLTSFLGTDTTAGVVMLDKYYGEENAIYGMSVPASEHSVMCSWDTENDDYKAIGNMLDQYPTGIVSIVSDTYDLWNAIENYFGGAFKDKVLSRDGKTVIRPDSGDPVKILCGDPDAPINTPEGLGVIRLLDYHFGSTLNSKGYKVLNPKVGCIYGDAIFYERAEEILSNLEQMGYASSNIVFGSGGLLLQQWSRDTFKMAIKATYCEVGGNPRDIMKDPVTDRGKRSHKGLLRLDKVDGVYTTTDNCTKEQESGGYLRTVYKDGEIISPQSISEIRERIIKENQSWNS